MLSLSAVAPPIRCWGSLARAIKGTEMIEIDVWDVYAMATAIHILHGVPVMHPQEAIIHMASATNALSRFGAHPLNTLTPKSSKAAGEVIACIDGLGNIKNFNENTLSAIVWSVGEFERLLEEESKHIYALCLEGQGLFSTYHLMEKIEAAFSKWDRFSIATMRELEEAGFCLAFERYTAAGFHSLRALETEVRDYVMLATWGMPKKRDLGHYIEILKGSNADQKLIAVLDSVRSLERNPLMHPEDWLKKDEATELFCIVQSALSRLIADVEKKFVLPPGKDKQ